MTLVLTLMLLGVVAAGVVVMAGLVVRWGRDGDVPGRPVWLGPDPAEVEDLLRQFVEASRLAAGAAPCEPDPAVVELARVHAFDMAIRGFADEQDPEGRDLQGRCEHLFPELRGELEQWQILDRPETGLAAGVIVRRMAADDEALTALMAQERWTALGVGVSIERGRCGMCVVVARLEPPVKREEGDLPLPP